MLRGIGRPIASAALLLCLAVAGRAAPQEERPDGSLPVRHLIAGVPFVRWGDAAATNYPNKNVLEPSFAAAQQMVLRYWGFPDLLQIPNGWPEQGQMRKGADLAAVKREIASGVPVIVAPALTPFAHRLYTTDVLRATLGGTKIDDVGSWTNQLGRMIGLEQLGALRRGDVFNESFDMAARVVIGYDDERGVLTLHDPSFGPTWELSYADFEVMWRFFGGGYFVIRPPNAAELLAHRPAAAPYPARSPDNEAAVHFVYGYALQSVGRVDDAARELATALAIPGISVAYQHLLHLELASTSGIRDRHAEAAAEVQKAIDVYPADPAAWKILSGALAMAKAGPDWKKRAEQAGRRAKELCTPANERAVARVLANDFRVLGCGGGWLGWGIR